MTELETANRNSKSETLIKLVFEVNAQMPRNVYSQSY